MKYKAFSVYSAGKWDQSDKRYMFSVIAGPNEVEYIIPVDNMDMYRAFDKERIRFLMDGIPEEGLPTTPTEWALLAVQNMSENCALMPSRDISNDYQLLYEEEKFFADTVGEAQARKRLGLERGTRPDQAT